MKRSSEETKSILREYILKRFLKNQDASFLKDSTPLISGGIIDSISTMQLVAFLEKEFGFEFEAHEVDRDNLDSVQLITDFISSKTGG